MNLIWVPVERVIESMCTNGYKKNWIFFFFFSLYRLDHNNIFFVFALNMYMHVHPVIYIDAFYICLEKKKQWFN